VRDVIIIGGQPITRTRHPECLPRRFDKLGDQG